MSALIDVITHQLFRNVVKTYCRLIEMAGFNISLIGEWGPQVPIVTIAGMLGVDSDTLREFLEELSRHDRRIEVEEAVALPKNDPSRYVVRLHKSVISEVCGS